MPVTHSAAPDRHREAPGYDVAISVGSADCAFAAELQRRLQRHRVRAYFYEETPEETLGEDLKAKLVDIYSRATIVVVLHSKNYASEYTRIELDAAVGSGARIVPVPLDSHPMPEPLAPLTFWDFTKGSDRLLQALLRMLRRRPLGPIAVTLLAVAASALAALFVQVQLGLRDLGRPTDAGVALATLLPVAWVVLFKLLPVAVQTLRARRMHGAALLQTPLLRRLEAGGNIAFAVVAVSLVTSIALALEKHRDIVQRQAAMDAVSIELESVYRQLFNQQTEVLRLGSILATVLDDDRRRAISVEFEAAVTNMDGTAQLFLGLIAKRARAQERVTEIQQHVDTIVRTGQRHIGHQAQELLRLGDHSSVRNTDQLRTAIVNYLGLATDEVFALQRAFRAFQKDIELESCAHREKWRWVLEPCPELAADPASGRRPAEGR